jgi:cell shape-determining protein MreC
MSYLLDRKTKRQKNLAIFFSIIFLIIFFYFRNGIWSGFSRASLKIFRPVLVGGNNAGGKLGSLGAYFVSKGSLSRENEALRLKLGELEAKILNHDALLAENEILKEIIGRQKEDRPFILAVILSKPNQTAYDTLLVDAGEKNGVKVGDMVFAMGDIPIGRVGATTPSTATIILFSSSLERTQAVISDVGRLEDGRPTSESSILYELVGRGGGNFEMILPRDVILEVGDQAILPGMYPYVVATVETIISDPRDSFTKALFVSPVNIQGLKFVQVRKD